MLKKAFVIIFAIFFTSCSSSYASEYEDQVIIAHQEFYGLKFSTDPSDLSSIVIKVKIECKNIQNEIESAESQNVSLETAIDSHYIELRKTDKSHDESLENRNLNKTPQQTEDYMFILYKYCGFDDILNEFWGSQSLRENSFQNNS